ncbi:hypothetical protein AQUCO_00600144v1 [Aquilegia coerulea]|uniref:NADP-dependent oxidoreductase domain-containing protein n=1 Tax=Aquilegia coerulea TaxID=218851 RepID=A0A2G5EN68_AQUCA|nr:hypothetical protein AQUCO_00600144v1 [Aquilegia coerulea]
MTTTLNNGITMSLTGLGVWRMEEKLIKNVILNAIKIGYRHFDCAAKYQNEAEVGEALAEAFDTGLVKREDIFITIKLWNFDHRHVLEACKDSLKKLQLDYLDLYLVHYPIVTKHTGIGKTASVRDEDGVLDIDSTISLETTWQSGMLWKICFQWDCNYSVPLIGECLAYAKVKPAVNQIETHPYFQCDSIIKFCRKHGICVTAHTSQGGATANVDGSVSFLEDPVLKKLADKYKKTVAQIVLCWNIHRNMVVIPKSSKIERLQENFSVFDFELTEKDMVDIMSVDWKLRCNQPAKSWDIFV